MLSMHTLLLLESPVLLGVARKEEARCRAVEKKAENCAQGGKPMDM